MMHDQDRRLFDSCKPFFNANPVIFDVGAYVGEFSEYVQSVVNAVCYLFEPNPVAFDKINSSNKWQLAFSDKIGMASFYVCEGYHGELSSLFNREVFSSLEIQSSAINVMCDTIDNFSNEHGIGFIDFVKIDTEGAEANVLKGMRDKIQKDEVGFIQVEYGGTYLDAKTKFADIITFADELGLMVYEDRKRITWENFIEDYQYRLFILTKNIHYAA